MTHLDGQLSLPPATTWGHVWPLSCGAQRPSCHRRPRTRRRPRHISSPSLQSGHYSERKTSLRPDLLSAEAKPKLQGQSASRFVYIFVDCFMKDTLCREMEEPVRVLFSYDGLNDAALGGGCVSPLCCPKTTQPASLQTPAPGTLLHRRERRRRSKQPATPSTAEASRD